MKTTILSACLLAAACGGGGSSNPSVDAGATCVPETCGASCAQKLADVPACGAPLSVQTCDQQVIVISLTGVDTAKLFYYDKQTGALQYIGDRIGIRQFVCMNGVGVSVDPAGCGEPVDIPDCDAGI